MKWLTISLGLIMALIFNSCTTSGIFGTLSPHQQYESKLRKAGLEQSALGQLWISEAVRALQTDLSVNIPYRENGYFAADVPQSAGLRFRPKQGQLITIKVEARPARAQLFVELWRATGNANKPRFVIAADSSLTIIHEVDDNNELLLRIQPELLVSVSYTLTVYAEPSLAFPVPGNSGKKIGSFWGDQRGGGTRKHEGVDIFDSFRTPLIAVDDGLVSRTGENGLGGKVIWLHPKGKNYNLYYAHLDEQLVGSMQRVKKGDTIGLMGNTGNARTTPPHLHFGIYARGGAIDPLPFIQQVSKETAPVKGALLNVTARTRKLINLQNTPEKSAVPIIEINAGTYIRIVAATGNYYKVVLSDATVGFIPVAEIHVLEKPLETTVLSDPHPLLSTPDSLSAVITMLPARSPVAIFAQHGDYVYVAGNQVNGWMIRSRLKNITSEN